MRGFSFPQSCPQSSSLLVAVPARLLQGIHIVCVVVQQEADIRQVALAVRKLLQHIHAVGVKMAAVLERIIVAGVGALPSQHHLVGVVGIAQLCVGGESGRIGDPHPAEL